MSARALNYEIIASASSVGDGDGSGGSVIYVRRRGD
jgi:hypothetical protein